MSRSSEFTRRRSGGSDWYEAGERPESTEDRQRGDRTSERSIGYDEDVEYDWGRIGVFGAGFALGAALGAAAGLLFAPRPGEDTRELIGEQAKELGGRAKELGGRAKELGDQLGDRAADSWDDLRDELRWLARRGRKSVRRGMTRSRWAAEDAVAKGR